MGCNCGKNKVRPLGAGGGTSTETTTVYSPGHSGDTQSFAFNGQTFGSRLEYDAAVRRYRGI